jgi:hypothetical protein
MATIGTVSLIVEILIRLTPSPIRMANRRDQTKRCG